MVYDRRACVSLWQSAAEPAGAVDDVLRVGGADHLRDANCVSSRNIELLNGQSFSQAVLNVTLTVTVRNLRFRDSR